jgi:hypothetical protein
MNLEKLELSYYRLITATEKQAQTVNQMLSKL